MSTENPYLPIVHRNLPRILGMFDRNPASATQGMGDRYFWAWKLIDFPNGTFQGTVNGLARLLKMGALPEGISASALEGQIKEIVAAVPLVTRRDGSMEEAFPREGSWCVTALVAHDLLTAAEQLKVYGNDSLAEQCVTVSAPLVRYVATHREQHAVISNHLATGAAALLRWGDLAQDGETRERGDALLANILSTQHDEGWFPEYGGMDPGYMSLCLYYLVSCLPSTAAPDTLRDSIRKALEFSAAFCHPDGSFGGTYGSRNTRFCIPAAYEWLSSEDSQLANALKAWLRTSLGNARMVSLDSIDPWNLPPVFNAYCLASELAGNVPADYPDEALPHAQAEAWKKEYPGAGIFIDKRSTGYTIVSSRKGGVCYHFPSSGGAIRDGGMLLEDEKGRTYSTQHEHGNPVLRIAEDAVTVEAELRQHIGSTPGPFSFAILRLFSCTVFRNGAVREGVKRVLVKLLITGKGKRVGGNTRKITLSPGFSIEDETQHPMSLIAQRAQQDFSAIHMASQGYWQAGD